MTTTAKLRNFARRVAIKAVNENPEDDSFTFIDYYNEYIAQIKENDYSCLVSYAEYKGMRIPAELKNS